MPSGVQRERVRTWTSDVVEPHDDAGFDVSVDCTVDRLFRKPRRRSYLRARRLADSREEQQNLRALRRIEQRFQTSGPRRFWKAPALDAVVVVLCA